MSLVSNASPERPQTLRALEVSVERLTGRQASQLRASTITEVRRELEQRTGRPVRFVSKFPFIGRGNVLRDRVVSHEAVERQLDQALG